MVHSLCSMDHGLWIMDHLKPESGRDIRNGSSTSSRTDTVDRCANLKGPQTFQSTENFQFLGIGFVTFIL
jgi:hypothetical protein